MRSALILMVAAGLAGCTVPAPDANEALAAYGFRDIELGGLSMFGCSKDDDFTRTFSATGPSGQRVRGVICKGLFKGSTVRITGRA